MKDMDPRQQKFPLILYPFAALIYGMYAAKAFLVHIGLVRPPSDEPS